MALPLKVEGERFAPVQCFDHPLVGLIPGGIHHAGEQYGIACPEGGQILGGAGVVSLYSILLPSLQLRAGAGG